VTLVISALASRHLRLDSSCLVRAIMLQTKTDLLSIGLGGVAILLQDLKLGSVASVVKASKLSLLFNLSLFVYVIS